MLWAFLTSRIGKLLALIVTGAGALLGAIQLGRHQQRQKDRVDDLEEYIETKEKVDAVEKSPDSDAAFQRLRDNGIIR